MEGQPASQTHPPSNKTLKTWFDEFKARVAKKSQPNRTTAGETTNPATSNEESPDEAKASPQESGREDGLRSRDNPQPQVETINVQAELIEHGSVSINSICRKRKRSLFSELWTAFGWIVYYLIPFNYNLPWKLLSLINFSFVIIVIGLASGSSESSEAFNFTNGFLCGLATASICSVILTLSFIVYILPRTQDTASSTSKINLSIRPEAERSSFNKTDASLDCLDLTDGDFCLLDELNLDDHDPNLEATFQVSDEDYKGWMIEFIGDYEQRNSSDIKLKSIYVKIEKRVLYLCKTKNNSDSDSNSIPTFTSQRVFDLNNVEKFATYLLIPRNVRNKTKYVWSKKYPIRLEFQIEETDETAVGRGAKQIHLTLLAKSCREKEEWFRKFKRIAEIHRLGVGRCNTRSSLKSDAAASADEGPHDSILSSFKKFRCRSPSPRRDCVQSSQSSHFISEQKKTSDEEDKSDEPLEVQPTSGLARTKSCELLHSNQFQADPIRNDESRDVADRIDEDVHEGPDDSTLTRETADMFSQNIDYANFLESQPSLNYKEFTERLIEMGKRASPRSDWFNALTGRIFFDVLSHNYWSLWFKRKIQRKLYRIRLPYFMETLTLTQIDLGTNAPQFFDVESHSFDSLGLSIDFAMTYTGGLTMTFGTKLNLLKIKSDTATSGPNLTVPGAPTTAQPHPQSPQSEELSSQGDNSSSNMSSSTGTRDTSKLSSSSTASTRTSFESTASDSDDSDSDSSSGSSFGEAEQNEISDWEDYGAEKTRQNILKFVDKIASSKYFQQATENRYIKKKLQDISNCPLVLVVKIQSLNGVLTLNVPPPQTDRIWYGFKPMPELELKAIPKMGDREVSLSHVTDWIERKLADEFKKILVIPNMEDIPLPVLRSDHMQFIRATK